MYKKDTPEFAHHVATYGPQSTFGYKDFIPMFKAERFDARSMGGAVQGGRREVRRAGRGASRRLPDVRLLADRLERGEDGTQARRHRRAGRGRAGAGPRVRRVLAPRRALVVLRPGHDVRLGRARSEERRRSTAPPSIRRRPRSGATPPDQAYLDDWLARTAELVDKYQPQLVWFDWWIAQPAFQYAAPAASRPSTTTAGRSGERASPSTTRSTVVSRSPTPRRARHRARPAGGHPAELLADRHVGLEELLGLHRGPGVQDRRFHRGRPRGHRQQERQPAAEHRPQAGWHDSRAGGRDT